MDKIMENQFDVFLWANEIDEIKNNVSVELFLFNKHYTPFKVKYSNQLTNSIKSLFMQSAIKYIITKADKGLEFVNTKRTTVKTKSSTILNSKRLVVPKPLFISSKTDIKISTIFPKILMNLKKSKAL